MTGTTRVPADRFRVRSGQACLAITNYYDDGQPNPGGAFTAASIRDPLVAE